MSSCYHKRINFQLKNLSFLGDDAAMCRRKSLSCLGSCPDNYPLCNHSYQKVLEPLGFKAVSMEDNGLAIKPRRVHDIHYCSFLFT
jgi:hypothetical protein